MYTRRGQPAANMLIGLCSQLPIKAAYMLMKVIKPAAHMLLEVTKPAAYMLKVAMKRINQPAGYNLRPSSCLYMTQAHCIHILVDTQQY
jgi:hypothetical protein